ncbi:MAG: hypothetical protein NVS3B21_33210 [Acidimicrobiales bacterium]
MARPAPTTQRAPRDVRRGGKPKVCIFCSEHIAWVDYKDVNVLRRFMSDRGKIKARSASGCCAQHQRDVALAIKTARELALLPYLQRTVVSDRGGRGGRGPGRGPRRDDAAGETSRDTADTATAGTDDAAPDDAGSGSTPTTTTEEV